MRLIMKCGDTTANIPVDSIERKDNVIAAYRKRRDEMIANEFVGMFNLDSMDYLYVSEERSER